MTVKLHSMKISKEHLGFLPDKREAFLFTLENENGISLKISNYGGTILYMMVPDKSGSPADVILGYSTWEEWIDNGAYFNCIVGRTSNRIGGARFSIDGIEFQVSANQDKFQLHGGFHGSRTWSSAWRIARNKRAMNANGMASPLGGRGPSGERTAGREYPARRGACNHSHPRRHR